MQVNNFARARRYAVAFLNVWYPGGVSTEIIRGLSELTDFMSGCPLVSSLISSPSIRGSVRLRLVHNLMMRFGLNEEIERFVVFVIDMEGAIFMPTVVWHVISESRKRRNECSCEVSSSHRISLNWQKKIITVFSKIVGAKLIAKFRVDESLICGVCIRNDGFIWERSVSKRLRAISRLVEREANYDDI